MNFEDYSKHQSQFLQPLPVLLEKLLEQRSDFRCVADIGCGDGSLLYQVAKRIPDAQYAGVDLSHDRLQRLVARDPNVQVVQADACNLSLLRSFLGDQKCDLIISSQVIEHVDSDSKMVQELSTVMASRGHLYISSVVKRWYGWWIYKCNGKVTCDPTHVREYSSQEELVGILESNGFSVLECLTVPFKPSVFNFLLRLGIRLKLLNYAKIDLAIQKRPRLFHVLQNSIRVWAPGYFIVELIAVKK